MLLNFTDLNLRMIDCTRILGSEKSKSKIWGESSLCNSQKWMISNSKQSWLPHFRRNWKSVDWSTKIVRLGGGNFRKSAMTSISFYRSGLRWKSKLSILNRLFSPFKRSEEGWRINCMANKVNWRSWKSKSIQLVLSRANPKNTNCKSPDWMKKLSNGARNTSALNSNFLNQGGRNRPNTDSCKMRSNH